MRRLPVVLLVAALLFSGICYGDKAFAKEVEFTMSNYTHDYALRVTNIHVVAGQVKTDGITGQRMNNGKTRAIYINPSHSEESIQPLGVKVDTGSGDWVGFYAKFEVIGNSEICGENGDRCRLYFEYMDHEKFTMGLGTVDGWLGLGHKRTSDSSQSESTVGSSKSNRVNEPKDSPFLIKDAGCFTKDGHPWCKIHIEKK